MTTTTRQRVTVFINPTIVTHAKAQAVVEGVSLTDLVGRALIAYLPKKTVIKKPDIRTMKKKAR